MMSKESESRRVRASVGQEPALIVRLPYVLPFGRSIILGK
jgi:hypothetical protein